MPSWHSMWMQSGRPPVQPHGLRARCAYWAEAGGQNKTLAFSMMSERSCLPGRCDCGKQNLRMEGLKLRLRLQGPLGRTSGTLSPRLPLVRADHLLSGQFPGSIHKNHGREKSRKIHKNTDDTCAWTPNKIKGNSWA